MRTKIITLLSWLKEIVNKPIVKKLSFAFLGISSTIWFLFRVRLYDPERDGTKLISLGVTEHWNNSMDKQYSRDLKTGDGIELIYKKVN